MILLFDTLTSADIAKVFEPLYMVITWPSIGAYYLYVGLMKIGCPSGGDDGDDDETRRRKKQEREEYLRRLNEQRAFIEEVIIPIAVALDIIGILGRFSPWKELGEYLCDLVDALVGL